jgi:thymidine kinase
MSLDLIIGPMFSGKTSALISALKKYNFLGVPCVAYKPVIDDRKGDDEFIYSHDGAKMEAIRTATLMSHITSTYFLSSKVIMIEEGQFFPDLYEFVALAVEQHKKSVLVAGLDGDRFRMPFGQILDLIPIADTITKLKSICVPCNDGTPALFSYSDSKSTDTILVAGSDLYMPLCRSHYLSYTLHSNAKCPLCESDLAGSVYRPHCSECPWTSNDALLSGPSEDLPTIQVKLELHPTENQLEQTTEDTCQTSQFV